jgi:hypothetical protein
VSKMLTDGHCLELFNEFSLNQNHQILTDVFSTLSNVGIVLVTHI